MQKYKIPHWLFLLIFFIIVIKPESFPFFFFVGLGYLIYSNLPKNNSLSKTIDKEFSRLFQQKKNKPIDISPRNSSFSFSPPPMNAHSGKLIAAGIAVFAIVLVILDGFVSVPAGHVAVIFDRGRGVLPEVEPEGLHPKIPLWQQATIYATKKQVFTMAGDYSQEHRDADSVQGRSKDGQGILVDISITYRINGSDAPTLRQEFLTEQGYRETIVRPAARSVVYDAVGQFNALELISEKRLDFIDLITNRLRETYGKSNIQLEEVFVRKVTFSPEFSRAIEEKQIAEQRIKTAENQKLEAVQLAEKKVEEAKGEAEAISLKGKALRENPEIIQLEFVNKMAPNMKWGILPDGALPLLDLKTLQQ